MKRFARFRAVVAIAGIACGMFFVAACNEDSPPVDAPPTPASPATVETLGTAIPAPPTATPTEVPPIFRPLVAGEPVTIPEGYALYVMEGCYACDGPATAVLRVRMVDGVPEVARVFERDLTGPTILGGWTNQYGLFVTECTTGVCFGVESSEDASVSLYHSEDAGETWVLLSTLPGGMAEPADWVDWLVPGVVPVIDWSEADTGLIVVDGVEMVIEALDLRGRSSPDGAAYGVVRPLISGPDGAIVRWFARVAPEQDPVWYLSVFDQHGAPRATWAARFNGVWLDEDRLLVTAPYGGDSDFPAVGGADYAVLPSVVDIRDGTIHPIVEPFVTIEGRNAVLGALPE